MIGWRKKKPRNVNNTKFPPLPVLWNSCKNKDHCLEAPSCIENCHALNIETAVWHEMFTRICFKIFHVNYLLKKEVKLSDVPRLCGSPQTLTAEGWSSEQQFWSISATHHHWHRLSSEPALWARAVQASTLTQHPSYQLPAKHLHFQNPDAWNGDRHNKQQ